MADPRHLGPLFSTRTRIVYLTIFLAVIAAAELLLVLATIARSDLLAVSGLVLDTVLVLILPVFASSMIRKDEPLAYFLGALVLVPLLRVVSLSTPLSPFSTVQWLGLVSVPLLLAAVAMMRAQGLRPRDVFLGIGERRFLGLNVAVVASGFFFGFLEYQILHPAPWIPAADPGQLVFAAIVVFVSTGLAEELIFRGILLRTGIRLLGLRGALIYITIVFAILHIGFLSQAEIFLTVLLGLWLGVVVVFTRSLWGAAGAHALASIALYLLFPLRLL